MERQFKLDFNGQQVQQQDFNLLGEVSGLSDDRVLAELFRIAPYGSEVARGIIPYAHQTSADSALVAPNGATGSVLVRPFRAIIGSRTGAGTDARENWRDIRSGLSVATGDTALNTVVPITANASGDNRIDLVYAVVSIDAAVGSETRKVKNPTTKAVTSEDVDVALEVQITFGVVAGEPTDDPDDPLPELPTDAGDTYYIPLAYICVEDGFGATSTYVRKAIAIVAPVLSISSATGTTSIQPANQHSLMARTPEFLLGTMGGSFMPSTMSGGQSILLALDFYPAGGGFASGDVVDDRDWRGRLCRWMVSCGGPTANNFAWNFIDTVDGDEANFPGPLSARDGMFFDSEGDDVWGSSVRHGFANTFFVTTGEYTTATIFKCADIGAPIDTSLNYLGGLGAGTTLTLSCSKSDGKLRISWTGTNPGDYGTKIFAWLDFTGVFENAPVVDLTYE